MSQGEQQLQCSISASVVNNLQSQLATVVKMNNGGLFSPNLMWSAVVDRQGVLLFSHTQRPGCVARQPLDCHRQGQHRQ